MIIRFAVENDLNSIAELYVHNHKITYRNLLSEEYLNSLTVEGAKSRWQTYLAENNKIWVACESDIFLGFAAGKKDEEIEDAWYLDSLHVSEFARGRGIGTEFIRNMGRYASENGYKKMSICVVKGNENAKNLYLRLGAKPYKEFKDSFEKTSSNSEKLLWYDINRLL
jgi:ribosomal protein S18 acetylase RimI-like enzyme